MNILSKLKETAVSVIPVMAIVILLGLTIVPLERILLIRFFIGGILLIFGLTVFLLGVDLGIQPMGERCGAELTKKRSLVLLLCVAFLIGFIVTAAEPDIQVFANQVKNIFAGVNKILLTFVIAAGVGLFITIGLLRSVLNLSLKISFLISYSLVFFITVFVPESFIGIAFDSGGATTGPMTVPFIMALGLGVSSVRDDDKNSFGLTGICSVGPVLAVLIYSIFIAKTGRINQAEIGALANSINSAAMGADEVLQKSSAAGGIIYQIFSPFGKIFSHVLKEALISIFPLFVLFLIFQFSLLRMTLRQVIKITIGFIYAFIGLTVFLVGVNGGFMQAGKTLGDTLGQLAINKGGFYFTLLLIIGFILGAIIVCAEPAVWVLSEQVEAVSGGTIKRKILLIFLSAGTALAIALSLCRAVFGFNLRWILIPGYIISMLLMIFSPSLFSGIAFDSGGVASGPLTSTFVLSFTLGAASSGKGGNDSFGVIALVAMMPLIAIQIMGIIFKFKQKKTSQGNLPEGGVTNDSGRV